MDSANSASLQSSSDGGGGGGDEDYDSRAESMASFLNHPSTHINQNPNPILQSTLFSSSSHLHQPPNSTFYDPSSANSYFPPSDSTKVNAGFDPDWSRNIRPDSNFTGFGATRNDDVYLNSQQGMLPIPNQSPPVSTNANAGRGSDHQLGVAAKNPKKRTRASRRAPTTVLTTDTTNFRQMVQEFTGIPTPPFATASSSPFSRRLDLFGGGIGPLYPIRPVPEKLQLEQPSNTTSVDASSSNYQLLPPEMQGFPKQPQTLFNSQNPLFAFQSHLQAKLQEQVNARILGATKSDNQQSDHQSGVSSSSTRWTGQNENLVNFDGGNGNTSNVEGYKLNSLSFDHQTEKGLENVVSSRNGVDQAQGNNNVDSWLCPSD